MDGFGSQRRTLRAPHQFSMQPPALIPVRRRFRLAEAGSVSALATGESVSVAGVASIDRFLEGEVFMIKDAAGSAPRPLGPEARGSAHLHDAELDGPACEVAPGPVTSPDVMGAGHGPPRLTCSASLGSGT